MVVATPYDRSVFINCPFDAKYAPLFNAMVFTVFDCGFVPRCSLEFDDGSRVRIGNLLALIKACQYGIHDLSRTQSSRGAKLPRFNMPLELGIFLGAKECGGPLQESKVCLILDTERYRYQSFISDIAGQDPHAHEDRPEKIVTVVRKWLATNVPGGGIPGGHAIWTRYQRFLRELPDMLKHARLRKNEVTFVEYTHFVSLWLRRNA